MLDDTLVTSSEMVFRIARFEDELTISVDTEFVETLDGEPVSMRSTTDLGGARPSRRTSGTARRAHDHQRRRRDRPEERAPAAPG